MEPLFAHLTAAVRALVSTLTFWVLTTLTTSAADIGFRDGPSKDGRPPVCHFHIVGDIASGDGNVFRTMVLKALEKGCLVGSVTLFSAGGSIEAAIDIGQQVNVLAMTTVAPTAPSLGRTMMAPPPAIGTRPWECFLGGKLHSTYDPITKQGDRNCVCASACFFIWAAGAERLGNVLVLHRPHFDSKAYSTLSVGEARVRFQALTAAAREYLRAVDIPDSLIARMLKIDSRDGVLLQWGDIGLLRARPYFEELAIATCGVSEAESKRASEAAGAKAAAKARKVEDILLPMLMADLPYLKCRADLEVDTRVHAKSEYLRRYEKMAPGPAAPTK